MAVVFALPIEEYPVYLAFNSTPSMTNADAAFPAGKLLTYDPTAGARTTANTTTITWDFLSPREFHVVALLYSNVSYAATQSLEASMDGSAWTILQDTRPFWAHRTTIPAPGWQTEAEDPRRGALARNCSWYYSASVQRWRYIRLKVSDPQTTSMTFGRLFVGKAFTPSQGIQYGSTFGFQDSGRRERTDRGAVVLDAGQTFVTASVKMEFLTAQEMYNFAYEFNYWRGSAREVLACLDTADVPNLQKNILYATLAEGRTIAADAFNAYSKTWTLESLA